MPVSQSLPLSTRLSDAPQVKRNERLRKAQLGDGYIARAPQGKNWVYLTLSVSWDALTYAEFQTIQTAVDAIQPDGYFTYSLPQEITARKWRIENFSYVYKSVYINAKMDLIEVFV